MSAYAIRTARGAEVEPVARPIVGWGALAFALWVGARRLARKA